MWYCHLLLLFSAMVGVCTGHGRLIDPPSRASAWRFGWGTPIDYGDNEGFCGGFSHQYSVQKGRCGICGDAWDEDPRSHEVGGKYATGTIVRQYTAGQIIPVKIDITSNHRGHFEFRICPNDNPEVEATQTCLNENPLFLTEGGFQYDIPSYSGEHFVQLQLPKNLTCTQCVFQWRYVAGNNWGMCGDGSGALGCGDQEEFRACADVAISAQPTWSSTGFTGGSEKTKSTGGKVTSSYSWYTTPKPELTPTLSPTIRPPPPSTRRTTRRPTSPSSRTTPRRTSIRRTTILPSRTTTPRPSRTSSSTRRTRPFTRPSSSRRPSRRTTTTTTTTTARPEPIRSTTAEPSTSCKAVGPWAAVPGMDDWCTKNCFHVPPFCPASHCSCD